MITYVPESPGSSKQILPETSPPGGSIPKPSTLSPTGVGACRTRCGSSIFQSAPPMNGLSSPEAWDGVTGEQASGGGEGDSRCGCNAFPVPTQPPVAPDSPARNSVRP